MDEEVEMFAKMSLDARAAATQVSPEFKKDLLAPLDENGPREDGAHYIQFGNIVLSDAQIPAIRELFPGWWEEKHYTDHRVGSPPSVNTYYMLVLSPMLVPSPPYDQ